jgi:hypothetical protein
MALKLTHVDFVYCNAHGLGKSTFLYFRMTLESSFADVRANICMTTCFSKRVFAIKSWDIRMITNASHFIFTVAHFYAPLVQTWKVCGFVI